MPLCESGLSWILWKQHLTKLFQALRRTGPSASETDTEATKPSEVPLWAGPEVRKSRGTRCPRSWGLSACFPPPLHTWRLGPPQPPLQSQRGQVPVGARLCTLPPPPLPCLIPVTAISEVIPAPGPPPWASGEPRRLSNFLGVEVQVLTQGRSPPPSSPSQGSRVA